MSRLCFGGTFDPVHLGHLICARAAAEAAGVLKIVLIPNNRSPLKAGTQTPARLRHRWCQLAVAADPAFEVSDIELRRPDPSYTFDTVAELNREGGTPVAWLIGADSLQTLPGWHRVEELLSNTQVIVMRRPGYEIDWSRLSPLVRPLRQNVVTTPLVDISSTDIRRRVRDGRSIRYLVPEAVEADILATGAYRVSDGIR